MGNKPIKKYRAGQISLTVWNNKKVVDEKEVEYLSFNFEKSYKVNAEWKVTTSLNETDLMKVSELAKKAYADFVIKVQSEKVE